jgi:hypothetical protein
MMAREPSKAANPEFDLANVISDLKVLSANCKRDIANDYPWNVLHYREEFNRILGQLKQLCPEKCHDISEIIADARVLGDINRGGASARTFSYLGTIDAETSKLLGRMGGETSRVIDEPEAITILERICNRFDQVARQLRNRHNSRATLDVKDEYDVQDLMHALLKINFYDIRPEEWTPSYAGGCSRMDFLLKAEQVVVEVKIASNSLRDRQIADELILDIARYKSHADCKTLVCFVYDPDREIRNPIALEGDLAKGSDSELPVRVFVCPQ